MSIPSIHVAPTSSKSLLASNFKSEPTEIHLEALTVTLSRKKIEHAMLINQAAISIYSHQ